MVAQHCRLLGLLVLKLRYAMMHTEMYTISILSQTIWGVECTQFFTHSPQLQSPPAPESVQQTEEINVTEPPNNDPSSLSPPPPSESPKPSDSVPSTFQSLFSPPALRLEDGQGGEGSGSHTGRKLHAQLPQANVSSSRLRRLSDVEECDVQPEPSNFPLRYGQRRPSNASRKVKTMLWYQLLWMLSYSLMHYRYQKAVTHSPFSTLKHCHWEEIIWRITICSIVVDQPK